MSISLQSQSTFITRLPPEIREAIYLELWRTSGLRQHIVWHGEGTDRHFCRWPCTTRYEVDDRVQLWCEDLRRWLGVPLGEDISKVPDEEVESVSRRLQSPWMNHWACGERAEGEYGLEATGGFTTSEIRCWKEDRVDGRMPSRSPYLPMLLSCRLM